MDTLTTITRWIFTAALLYGVYTETGAITVLALALTAISIEILTIQYADKEKLKR